MILLFTPIFSTISVIEDRREGFLQAVLVAPPRRWSIAMGKILGGTLLAVSQGLLFLILAPTLGIRPQPLELLAVLTVIFAVRFVLVPGSTDVTTPRTTAPAGMATRPSTIVSAVVVPSNRSSTCAVPELSEF